jgi:hypothetical protein
MPDRVVAARRGRRGRSSPELRATRQWCSIFGGFLPTEPVECEELTKGVFYRRGGGGSRIGHAMARFKLQPSATVRERSKGRLTTRLGEMGALWNVEHRRQVDGSRGESHAAW